MGHHTHKALNPISKHNTIICLVAIWRASCLTKKTQNTHLYTTKDSVPVKIRTQPLSYSNVSPIIAIQPQVGLKTWAMRGMESGKGLIRKGTDSTSWVVPLLTVCLSPR